jgi:ADP-ribosylglycohydrolase
MAANPGDDADTTGETHDQLAGVFYGFKGIPLKWRDAIANKEWIVDFADKPWLPPTNKKTVIA